MLRYMSRILLGALMLGGVTASVARVDAAEPPTVVTYRLTAARSMHLHDKQAAQQYEQTLKQLGCEVQASGHDGHIDLAYRCRDWRQATFADHASAHKWQDWLGALGFETQHQH